RVGARGLRAERGRDAVAHRAEAAGGDERAWLVTLDVLHRPHLVLADAGRPDDVAATGGQLLERLEHALRLQQRTVLAVAEGELLAPGRDLRQPRLGPPGLDLDDARELGEHRLQRADDRDVGAPDLRDLRRVDVEV